MASMLNFLMLLLFVPAFPSTTKAFITEMPDEVLCDPDPNGATDISELQDHFYPFGLSNGDTEAPEGDEITAGTVQTDYFKFYGSEYNRIWVSQNGLISFLQPLNYEYPYNSPMYHTPAIAPYWTDVDTSVNDGCIYYRLTTDSYVTQRISDDVAVVYTDAYDFHPLWVFLATWHNVTFSWGTTCSEVNTFQVALASDGNTTFGIFNYGNLTWPSYPGANDAKVGFYIGDNMHYFELPTPSDEPPVHFAGSSNSDVVGHWVFKVDCPIVDNNAGECPIYHRYSHCLQNWTAHDGVPDHMYLFGEEAGDAVHEVNYYNYDSYTLQDEGFPIFGFQLQSFQIQSDGSIYGTHYGDDTFSSGRYIYKHLNINVFYANYHYYDYAYITPSSINYRTTYDVNTLDRIHFDVYKGKGNSSLYKEFYPTRAHIITWANIPLVSYDYDYDVNSRCQTGEGIFQIIMATNGTQSFIILGFDESAMSHIESTGHRSYLYMSQNLDLYDLDVHRYYYDSSEYNLQDRGNSTSAWQWVTRMDCDDNSDECPDDNYGFNYCDSEEDLSDTPAPVPSHMYPYGQESGDSVRDERFPWFWHIDVPFPYFGQQYSKMLVCDGVIILENDSSSNETTSTDSAYGIVLPYEINNDYMYYENIHESGEIYFRLSTDPVVLNMASNDVQLSMINENGDFQATAAYILTWQGIKNGDMYYSYDDQCLENTFQTVIITDGVKTFIMYNYGNMTWPSSVNYNYGGHWQKSVRVGFVSGQRSYDYYSTRFHMHELNMGVDVIDIENSTNVGVPGRWLHRVDCPATDTTGDCLALEDPFHCEAYQHGGSSDIPDHIVAFGSENGDSNTESSYTTDFPFFGKIFNSLHIQLTGQIHMYGHEDSVNGSAQSYYDGSLYAFINDWSNSQWNEGKVYSRPVADVNQLDSFNSIIHDAYEDDPVISTFAASSVLVVTWVNITGMYGTTPCTHANTFQAVLLTDEVFSFVVYNYGIISYPNNTWSYWSKPGMEFQSYNYDTGEDTYHSYELELSWDSMVSDIVETSNVGTPGRWVIRVDCPPDSTSSCRNKTDDSPPVDYYGEEYYDYDNATDFDDDFNNGWSDYYWYGDLEPCSNPAGALSINDVPGHLYPFGYHEGDHSQYSRYWWREPDPVYLHQNFEIFEKSHSTLWVNNNGFISFASPHWSRWYEPVDFPVTENQHYWYSYNDDEFPMIAPYWAFGDQRRNNGTIYYRQTTDPHLLDRASRDIRMAFSDSEGYGGFMATWMFVATWHNITFYGGPSCAPVNTFQAALISDGTLSFTVFNYADITWTSSIANRGNTKGLGGNEARAGYDADDGQNYYNIPISGSPLIVDIEHTTNVGHDGRWVFRLDGTYIPDTGECPELQCPPNQMYNAASDTCLGDEYPAMSACGPILVGPVVEDDIYVMFYCKIMLETSDPTARVKVTFTFDDVPSASVPEQIIAPPETRAQLHEKYLNGQLGKRIGCIAATYWDGLSTYSASVPSNTYWAGIKPSEPLVTLTEDSENNFKTVDLFSTLPITCAFRQNNGNLMGCDLHLRLLSSDNTAVYTLDRISETISMCKYSIKSSDWDDSTGFAQNKDLVMSITLKRNPLAHSLDTGYVAYAIHPESGADDDLHIKYDKFGTPYTNPWHSGSLGNITVFREGAGSNGAMCYSSGDPRIGTFDNLHYSAGQTGMFILARSSSPRLFEVHVRHWACSFGSTGCSIACAVAVREGNVAYGLDMCNDNKRVYRLRLSKAKLSYRPIKADSSRTHWMIKMPSGSFLEIYINTWGRGGMNIYLNVPSQDKGKTEGLCGTYDGNRTNDFRKSDGTYADFDSTNWWDWWSYMEFINSFIESWRIPAEESLFLQPPPYNSSLDKEDEFCSCSVDSQTCGPDSAEDPISSVGKPGQGMPESIPPWVNLPFERKKRSPQSSGHRLERRALVENDIDDDIADDYVVVVEEDESNSRGGWPTWNNITQDQAISYCDVVLRNSTAYHLCDGIVPEDEFQVLVGNCMEDIGLTGDFAWAQDKIADITSLCYYEVLSDNNTQAEGASPEGILETLHIIAAALCPGDCDGHGSCVSSVCQCDTDYTGSDCSVLVGEPPKPVQYLNPVICDTQLRPCQSIRVLVEDLVNSPNLTCQIDITQMEGNTIHEIVSGTALSYNEVECPLPPMYDQSNALGPAYHYNVSLSNDGQLFSTTFTPQTVTEGGAVYDSTCVQCSQTGIFSQMADTCIIESQCFLQSELNPDNICEECNFISSTREWSHIAVNGGPDLLHTSFSKEQNTDLEVFLLANDPEGHAVTFTLTSVELSWAVELNETGKLHWFAYDNETSLDVKVTATDECGAQTDHMITLIVTCPQWYSGPYCENYVEEGTWSTWTDFGSCSKNCDHGVQTRSRDCLRGECLGQNVEKRLCNTDSCQEDMDEADQGAVLIVYGSSVEEVALLADEIHEVTQRLLNEFCSLDSDKCCEALNYRSHASEENAEFIELSSIFAAKSYPKSNVLNTDSIDIDYKIIVMMSPDQLMGKCEGPRHSKRSIPNEYFAQDLLVDILSAGSANYKQVIGKEVMIEDSESKGGINTMYIIVGLLAAVIVVVLLVITVLACNGKLGASKKRPSSCSKRLIAPMPQSSQASLASVGLSVTGKHHADVENEFPASSSTNTGLGHFNGMEAKDTPSGAIASIRPDSARVTSGMPMLDI